MFLNDTIQTCLMLRRSLDMSAFYKSNQRKDEPEPMFDLYGVVNHTGGLLGGHYTSYARCPCKTDDNRSEIGLYFNI